MDTEKTMKPDDKTDIYERALQQIYMTTQDQFSRDEAYNALVRFQAVPRKKFSMETIDLTTKGSGA